MSLVVCFCSQLIHGSAQQLFCPSSNALQSCLGILRENMKDEYDKSGFVIDGAAEAGWNEELKRKELNNKEGIEWNKRYFWCYFLKTYQVGVIGME